MSVTETSRLIQHLRRTAGEALAPTDGQLLDDFISRRDNEAFAALIRRHGPMVWGVCRRLSGHEQDAEDAFQATFLILVRRAGSVCPREHVGNWLHGVAYRTARKARMLAERRKHREKQLAVAAHPVIDPIESTDDLRGVIDRELSRLPEKFRLPLLLCYLEGRSQREVARQLGLPVGTLCHRLQSARSLLAKRLIRRGVTLSVAAIAAAETPRTLAAVTLRASLQLAAGRELAAVVPPQIVALTHGALSVMTPSKTRLTVALAVLLLVGGLGFGARFAPALLADDKPAAKARPAAPPKQPDQIDDATFLRRISLDLRGMLPTTLEMKYFLADKDPKKRRKVIEWMLEKSEAKAEILKYLGEAIGRRSEEMNGAKAKAAVDSSVERALEFLMQLQQAAESPPSTSQTPAGKNSPANDPAAQLLEKNARVQKALRDDGDRKVFERWVSQLQAPKPGDSALADRVRKYEAAWRMAAIYREQKTLDDATFLRRIMLDLTGLPPTTLETKYFTSDKDADKRNKLIQWLLEAPDSWKHLAESAKWLRAAESTTDRAAKAIEGHSQPGASLLNQMLNLGKSNEQILDAITLAALGRFPTETERSFALAVVDQYKDRPAAWNGILKALTGSAEFRRHVEQLRQSIAK